MTDDPKMEFRPACSALRFRKAARCVTQIYDNQLELYGLTITQYGLLGHLRQFDGISIGALAEKLVMYPTTLTRNLRPLEKRGYVILTQDKIDRRSRRLSLTKTGKEKLIEAKPGWRTAQEKIARILGPADTAILSKTIDRMIEEIKG